MHELLTRPLRGLLLAATLLSGMTTAAASAEEARRIVVVGGALTEIVYALGAEDRIVGVDTTSLYPPETAELPKVGYMRRLSAEGVLSLTPDMALVAADAGPPAAIDAIRSAGVDVRVAPDDDTVDGVLEKIRAVGEILGLESKAETLAASVSEEMARVEAEVAKASSAPKVMFLLSTGGAPVAGGDGTTAATVIELAGGVNAVTGFEGYKPLSMEAAIAAQPDVILVPEHAVGMLGGLDAIKSRPELAATPAAQAGRIVVMDALLVLGFGPRTPEGISTLARALHPELSAD